MIQLDPCVHCNGDNVSIETEHIPASGGWCCQVRCNYCDAMGPLAIEVDRRKAQRVAAERYNRRGRFPVAKSRRSRRTMVATLLEDPTTNHYRSNP